MSYILDALKKIEREKARKERHSGVANISGELFREDPSTVIKSTSVAKISIVIILVALVTFGVTWYLFHDAKGQKVPSQQVDTSQMRPSSPQVSASPPPMIPPLTATPASPSVPPVASSTPIPLAVAPPVRSSAPVSGADSEEVEESAPTRRSQFQRSLNISSPVKAQHQNNESMSASADIKVSGIAWQDDRNARRAVVNGFLLQEGSVVSGAKITEIRQDKVRFSQDGRTFEVSLISTGMQLNKD